MALTKADRTYLGALVLHLNMYSEMRPPGNDGHLRGRANRRWLSFVRTMAGRSLLANDHDLIGAIASGCERVLIGRRNGLPHFMSFQR